MWLVFVMFSPRISFHLLNPASEFESFCMQFPWHTVGMLVTRCTLRKYCKWYWSNDYIPPPLPSRKDFPTRPQSVQTDLHFLQHFHQRGEIPWVRTAGPSVSGKGTKGGQWWLELASLLFRLFLAHSKRDEPHLSSPGLPLFQLFLHTASNQ